MTHEHQSSIPGDCRSKFQDDCSLFLCDMGLTSLSCPVSVCLFVVLSLSPQFANSRVCFSSVFSDRHSEEHVLLYSCDCREENMRIRKSWSCYVSAVSISISRQAHKRQHNRVVCRCAEDTCLCAHRASLCALGSYDSYK